MNNSIYKTQKIVVSALLGAVASVMMFFSFNLPFIPPFIRMDFSDLPALLAAYSHGPVAGVAVCFVKNIMNLFLSRTGGIGELANFLLGSAFVVPAGLLYRKYQNRKSALWGALTGAVTMAAFSVIINYYIIYPVYTKILPMETIMGMYQAILPSVENLWQALLIFNMPFTFIKAMLNVIMIMWIYKPLSPLIKKGK